MNGVKVNSWVECKTTIGDGTSLVKGKEYEVIFVGKGYIGVRLDNGMDMFWSNKDFKAITNTNQLTAQ